MRQSVVTYLLALQTDVTAAPVTLDTERHEPGEHHKQERRTDAASRLEEVLLGAEGGSRLCIARATDPRPLAVALDDGSLWSKCYDETLPECGQLLTSRR